MNDFTKIPQGIQEMLENETAERKEIIITALQKMDFLLDNMANFVDKCQFEATNLSREDMLVRGETFVNYLAKMKAIQINLDIDLEKA